MKILNHPNIGKKLSVGLTMMLKHVLKFAPDAREHTSRSTGEAEPFDINASISSIKASNVGASIIFKRSGSVDVADGIPQKRLQRSQERHYNYRNNWQHLRKPPRAPAPRRCALSPSSIPPRLYLAEQPSAAHHTLFPVQTLQLRRKPLLGRAAESERCVKNAPDNICPPSAEACDCL